MNAGVAVHGAPRLELEPHAIDVDAVLLQLAAQHGRDDPSVLFDRRRSLRVAVAREHREYFCQQRVVRLLAEAAQANEERVAERREQELGTGELLVMRVPRARHAAADVNLGGLPAPPTPY